jgi:Divergent InlB B-repeat domain
VRVRPPLAAAFLVLLLAAAPAFVHAETFYIYVTIELSGPGSARFQTLDDSDAPDGWLDCRIVEGFVDPRETCSQQFDGGDDHSYPFRFWLVTEPGSCRFHNGSCDATGSIQTTAVTHDLVLEYTINKVLYPVAVTRTGGNGAGTVGSDIGEPGIKCGLFCETSWYYDTAVTLTAVPDPGSYFAEWTGACAGQDATCDLVIRQPETIGAVFRLGNAPTPTVKPSPTTRATPRPTTQPGTSPGATAPAASADATGAVVASPAATGPGATVAPPGQSTSASSAPAVVATDGDRPAVSGLLPALLVVLAGGLASGIVVGLVGLKRRGTGKGTSGSAGP